MDILALIVVGLFALFIFRVTIGSFGLALGLGIGIAILGIIFGAYFFFFTSIFSLAKVFGTK